MASEKKLLRTSEPRIYSPTDLTKKWFVHYNDGVKRQRVYGSINVFSTFSDRMREAKVLLKSIKEGVTLGEKPQVVSRDLELALEWIGKQSWRAKTRATHTTVARAWYGFLGKRKGTPQRAQEFFQNLQPNKSPTTYNNYLNQLKAILNGIGQSHICEGIKSLRQNPTPARYFQSFQANRLAKAISERDPELYLFVQFMYYCFIRPRELVHLRVSNILLEGKQIYIPGQISKNKKSEYITIPDAFLPSLEFVKISDPNRLLFPSPLDITKPLGYDKMYRRHQRILKGMNFGKGYVLYSWKHTGAVMAVKAGISLKELQIQLRHHSLDQVDQYLRQMGVWDLERLQENFPALAS